MDWFLYDRDLRMKELMSNRLGSEDEVDKVNS